MKLFLGHDTSIKRGTAELAVLSVLEERPLHGYELARRIEQQTNGALRFTLASLYPLLYGSKNAGTSVVLGKRARPGGGAAAIG